MANKEYKATVGLDYGKDKRVEAGQSVSDLPKDSIAWLLSQGLITEVGKQEAVEEPVIEDNDELVSEE